MKLNRQIIISMFLAPLLFCLGIITVVKAPEANAASPECYKKNRKSLTVQKDCSEAFKLAAENLLGHGLKSDFCYFLDVKIEEAKLGSTRCDNLAAEAKKNIKQTGTNTGSQTGGNDQDLNTDALTNTSRTQLRNCRGTDCLNKNPLVILTKLVVNVLSALVAVVVIGVIIFAGIQYTSSGGDPNRAAQAKKRITNAIIALVAYMFLFTIFEYFIPGGLL